MHAASYYWEILCAVSPDDVFQLHQLGVACPTGTEKIIHGLRSSVEEHWDFMLKLDMRSYKGPIQLAITNSKC